MPKDKLDLLLVNVGGARKRVYQDLSEDYSAMEPPFWAALTAGFVRKKGFNVKILDANAENLNNQETEERIREINPNLVNIVVYGQQPAASTQLMDAVGDLCREIKKSEPDRKIILTGLHPSALPYRTLSEEGCDFVAEGEGFITVEGLIRNEPFSKIPGLWYKQDRKILSNPRAENISDLTSMLDAVAWDLLPSFKNYKAHNWQCLQDLNSRKGYASISTSLGCPHKCTFCSIHATFGEHRVRYWSPEWVLNQIDEVVKRGAKNIKIIDELFVLNPNHFEPICDGLIKRDYELNIWAYARVDSVKEKHLRKLKEAGFNWLGLGIESGSYGVRKSVSKGKFDETDIIKTAQTIKNHGINIVGNYMFGLPEDDLESMKKTLDLAMELNCEFANFYCALAYPGSQLYEESIRRGIKLPETWAGFSQHAYDCLPLSTNNIPAEEVLRFRDKAFEAYFTSPRYLTMVEGKFGRTARQQIEKMTKTKLKRKLLGD
jgi:anaerobic magnesium-protoporphyrin IX monomethyl ester cyclase